MGIEKIEYPRAEPVWTAWTPTVTQSGSVAHTVTVARYIYISRIVICYCYLAVTGAGTSGNSIIVGGLPFNISNASTDSVGTGSIRDTGTALYCVVVTRQAAAAVQFHGYNVANYMGIAPAFALANGDKISFTITYET